MRKACSGCIKFRTTILLYDNIVHNCKGYCSDDETTKI